MFISSSCFDPQQLVVLSLHHHSLSLHNRRPLHPSRGQLQPLAPEDHLVAQPRTPRPASPAQSKRRSCLAMGDSGALNGGQRGREGRAPIQAVVRRRRFGFCAGVGCLLSPTVSPRHMNEQEHSGLQHVQPGRDEEKAAVGRALRWEPLKGRSEQQRKDDPGQRPTSRPDLNRLSKQRLGWRWRQRSASRSQTHQAWQSKFQSRVGERGLPSAPTGSTSDISALIGAPSTPPTRPLQSKKRRFYENHGHRANGTIRHQKECRCKHTGTG